MARRFLTKRISVGKRHGIYHSPGTGEAKVHCSGKVPDHSFSLWPTSTTLSNHPEISLGWMLCSTRDTRADGAQCHPETESRRLPLTCRERKLKPSRLFGTIFTLRPSPAAQSTSPRWPFKSRFTGFVNTGRLTVTHCKQTGTNAPRRVSDLPTGHQ